MTVAHVITGLLLIANTAVVGAVVVAGAGGGLEALVTGDFVPLKERINQDRLQRARFAQQHVAQPGQRARFAQQHVAQPGQHTIQPGQHAILPGQHAIQPGQSGHPQHPVKQTILIAGMDGFQGDACVALAGFLDHMESGILEAGGQLPPVDRDVMLSGSCSIEDPMVNLSLRKYRKSWLTVGLKPLSPFRYLGKKP